MTRAIDLFRRLDLPDPETFGNRYPIRFPAASFSAPMTAMALCPKPDLVSSTNPRPRST